MTNTISLPSVAELPGWVPWIVGAVVLAFALIIVRVVRGWKREKVEDPTRLTKFFETVRPLDWDGSHAASSIDALNSALIDLFKAEVEYYYQTRKVRRLTSSTFRWTAYLFGTAGLVCPLLETAVPSWSGVSRLGYVLIAMAAASLAGNELFGGTRGHVRTVLAQYQLENALSAHVVAWSSWRSRITEPADWSGGFDLLKKLSDDVYVILVDETRQWGAAVVDAESAYRAGMHGSSTKTT